MEIKPLSFRGISNGILQMAAYEIFDDYGFKPDITWVPRAQPIRLRTGKSVFVANVGGLLFYTDSQELFEEISAITVAAALFKVLRSRVAAMSAMNEFAQIRRLTTAATSVRGAQLESRIGVSLSLRFI